MQLGEQGRLVSLRGEQVVRAAAGEVGGVATLGVQRVGGHDRLGDVDAVQQRRECRYLVGLGLYRGLPQHHPSGGVERREQMNPGLVVVARPAGGLPVHGDHRPSSLTGPQVKGHTVWRSQDLSGAEVVVVGDTGVLHAEVTDVVL